MAKFKNGINGPFSGKIGTVVGASCRGVDYGRSLPSKSTKPATPAQQLQRDKFKLLMGWLRPLTELISIGFQMLKGAKTPMNSAISYHLKEAVKEEQGELSIDFSKAIFSRGELLISWVLEVLCLAGSLLRISWQNAAEHPLSKGDDLMNFIVYNPNKEEFVTFEGVAKREDGVTELKLPDNFVEDTVHCWVSYVNLQGDAVSTSNYLGEMLVV